MQNASNCNATGYVFYETLVSFFFHFLPAIIGVGSILVLLYMHMYIAWSPGPQMQIVEEAIIEGVTGEGPKAEEKIEGLVNGLKFRVHIFVCNCGYLL